MLNSVTCTSNSKIKGSCSKDIPPVVKDVFLVAGVTSTLFFFFVDVSFCQGKHVMLKTALTMSFWICLIVFMCEHLQSIHWVRFCVCLSVCVPTHWFTYVSVRTYIVTSFTVTENSTYTPTIQKKKKKNPLSSCLCNHMKRLLDQWCVNVYISPYLCLLHSVRLIHINPSHTRQSQHPVPHIDKWSVSRHAFKVECCCECVVPNTQLNVAKAGFPPKIWF